MCVSFDGFLTDWLTDLSSRWMIRVIRSSCASVSWSSRAVKMRKCLINVRSPVRISRKNISPGVWSANELTKGQLTYRYHCTVIGTSDSDVSERFVTCISIVTFIERVQTVNSSLIVVSFELLKKILQPIVKRQKKTALRHCWMKMRDAQGQTND